MDPLEYEEPVLASFSPLSLIDTQATFLSTCVPPQQERRPQRCTNLILPKQKDPGTRRHDAKTATPPKQSESSDSSSQWLVQVEAARPTPHVAICKSGSRCLGAIESTWRVGREPSNHRYVVGSRGDRQADSPRSHLQERQPLLGRHRVDAALAREPSNNVIDQTLSNLGSSTMGSGLIV